MRHYFLYLLILLSGSCFGDFIDIKEPTGTEFTYRSTGSVFVTGYCSYNNFYLEPAVPLPNGFDFVGSHSFTIYPNGSVIPSAWGGYPTISATGHQSRRGTIWPFNPRNPPEYLGLHWLCGSPHASGTYGITVPHEIKVQRTGAGSSDMPSQKKLQLTLWYLNSGKSRLGAMQNFDYELVPPPMISVGKIMNEPYMDLLAGEQKEILRGTGKYSLVDICVSMTKEEEWFWLENRSRRKIVNGSCMKAQDTLPISVVVSKHPPIGTNNAGITFTAHIN
ncbi:hypothetical protein [Escherichia albertii]|uniref:hypothetical protein n=1 Tax=Escherichia albertii TaxID=208962 RepID=UPI0010F60590|nr:hypothetical protein [Escherichia albertii]